MAERRETAVMNRDGFWRAWRRPAAAPRRAVVLIDPSYEIKTDHAKVVTAVREGSEACDAVILVWHPQPQRLEPREMVSRPAPRPTVGRRRGWLHASLTVAAPTSDGFGMLGLGMFVINPPFVLQQTLAESLPLLARAGPA